MKRNALYYILKLIFILLCSSCLNILFQSEVYAFTNMQGGSLTGEVILSSDSTLTSTITVPANGSLILDLNGYVLKHNNNERVIVVNAGATLTIKDSNPTRSHYGTITNNLWVYNASATSGVEIKGGIITGGTKSDRGGAIFNGGTIIMEAGTIAGCKAVPNSNAIENDMTKYPVNTFTNGTGGAIFINDGGNFTMNGGAIKHCEADISNTVASSGGGAVFVDANANNVGTFIMNGGIIQNCYAKNGGAVYVHANLTTGNTSETASLFEMNGGEISNCHSNATGNNSGGGAIFINAVKNENEVASVAEFNMTGGSLKNNTSKGMGGAVYSLGNFNMSNESTITGNNTTKTGETLNGKDVYTGFGGGVFLYTETSNFVMNGGTISDSIAASGGGVMVYTGASFTMNKGNITNCSSQGSGGTGNGGAVYVQASTFTFNEGTLEGNWARRYGGAININQTANLYLNGACNIINNTANHGGGISQEAGDCQIKLDNENILIKGNKAIGVTENGNGGGLFIEKGILEIKACTIVGNSAANNGGGIALRVERIGGDITVNMNGGIIKENTAGANGGGIDIFADYTFTEDDDSNDANQKNDVVVNLNTGVLVSNNADGNGGGINISVNEVNSTALMNIATDENSSTPEIGNNSALNKGGSICINGGSINMSDGVIDNCSASEGGGVYISGGDMTINGGQVNGCQATAGGGIYISNGDITMNGGTISNNQATEYGGGIYASSDTQDLNITITSGSIIGNISNGHGGGVGVDMGAGLSAKVIIGLESCNGLDENHSHPILTDNTANEKGGGLCLHGDSLTMTMYCGSISANIAIKEPGSSNINQTGGIVTVHAGTVNGGITIIGGQYIYVPNEQLSKVGIAYNSNIPNSTQIEQAEVTVGVEISLPKTLFTREGYILSGWSTIQEPSSTDRIYLPGETYMVQNQSVTLYVIWLKEGAGSVETPAIQSGKIYEKFTGAVNTMISSDSSFSTLMSVLDMQPSLYKERTLIFSHSLKSGTTIMMIDLSKDNERKYYYYKVENDTTNSIPLTSFTEMRGEQNYIDSTTTDLVNETFLFIVELPRENTTANSTQMKLIRYSQDSEIAQIEQTISYTTTTQRKFNFTWTNQPASGENIKVGDNFSLYYETENPIGSDFRFEGKKITLIIDEANGGAIPADAKLYDGTNYYELNNNGKFAIPLGEVNANKEISLELISKSLETLGAGCNLKAELWVSQNDETKPFMGEKVAVIGNISLQAKELPAIKVSMTKRVYHLNEFDNKINLQYETRNIDEYDITLELQKKNETGEYITQTGILNSVDSNTENSNGIFTLNIDERGEIKIKFDSNFVPEASTYRILIKVNDSSGNKLTIPYNFILIE